MEYKSVKVVQEFEFEGIIIIFEFKDYQEKEYRDIKVMSSGDDVKGKAKEFIIKKFKETDLYQKVFDIANKIEKIKK